MCNTHWKFRGHHVPGIASVSYTHLALEADESIEAVFLTSPTYDGIVSDIEKIAEIAHQHGIPLIVDEAHGAHLGFHPYFPKSAITLGADVVIQSLHKTLPAPTQTAILHWKSSYIKKERLEWFLNIYETSSPSYLFLASIDVYKRQLLAFINEPKKDIAKLMEYARARKVVAKVQSRIGVWL